MKGFDGAKKIYEETPVPEELGEVISSALREGDRRHGKVTPMKKRWNAWKAVACLLGVVLAGGMVAVNTSQAAAATLGELPVIGPLARILTIREYSYQDADMEIQAQVPAIVPTQQEDVNQPVNVDYAARVNEMIDKTVEEYTNQARQDIEEYKKAFLETGGTQEEFEQKDIKVNVSYEIKYQNDAEVSFVLTADENWCAAYGVQYYYNLNLTDGREITLKELLGDDYISIANAQILDQMQERTAQNPDYTYWGSDMDGFTTISEDSNFYINEAGNPVIVFDKYEVAPGFMGRQEFEIIK